MTTSKSFLESTKETWQPYYKEELTDLDIFEINFNISSFFDFLIRLESKGFSSLREGKATNE